MLDFDTARVNRPSELVTAAGSPTSLTPSLSKSCQTSAFANAKEPVMAVPLTVKLPSAILSTTLK